MNIIFIAMILGGILSTAILTLQKRLEPKLYNEEKFILPCENKSKIYLKNYKFEKLSEKVELLDNTFERFYESEIEQGVIVDPGEYTFKVKVSLNTRDGIRIRAFKFGPEDIFVDIEPDSVYMINGHGGKLKITKRS